MASGPASRSADRKADNPNPTDPEKIREAALLALERRRRTRWEIERILRRKGFKPVAFEPILDRLTEVGLINDREYASVYVRRRVAAKPRGALLLRSELLARGIAAEYIDAALMEMREESDPVDIAVRAAAPWLRRNEKREPRELRQKLWQYLARRGFSPDVIQKAADQALSGADDQ